MCICVCLYVYVYGSIVEPSGFRVLGFVVALGVPFNKQQLLSLFSLNNSFSRMAETHDPLSSLANAGLWLPGREGSVIQPQLTLQSHPSTRPPLPCPCASFACNTSVGTARTSHE